jgi:hypothetical protein
VRQLGLPARSCGPDRRELSAAPSAPAASSNGFHVPTIGGRRVTQPQRIQLSRAKGFRLQEASRALNGLPAVKCDWSSKRWGNPCRVGMCKGYTAADAVADYRRWIDRKPSVRSFENVYGKPPSRKEIVEARKARTWPVGASPETPATLRCSSKSPMLRSARRWDVRNGQPIDSGRRDRRPNYSEGERLFRTRRLRPHHRRKFVRVPRDRHQAVAHRA